MSPRRRSALAVTLAMLVVVSACSSDDSSAPASSGATASTAAAADGTAAASTPAETTSPSTVDTVDTAGTGATVDSLDTAGTADTTPSSPADGACVVPDTTTPLDADPLGNDQDYDVTSFDGTVIRAHWFPLPGLAGDATAPTVLMGPGWGSGGDTDTDSVGRLGAISISSMRHAGYNVLTWDPRGFGESTGTVTIDSAEYEGRDVQQLIDWVATLPNVALDGAGDPLMGMVGGSYGGGIQLVTAAIDCRVDAIVPVIAWNSLTTSLFKANTPKTGWAGLLTVAAFGADLDPTITRSQQSSTESGTVDAQDYAWFAARGPADLLDQITVPTLIIQGTVDTLFTLDEGTANYEALRAAGVPLAMLWFCGGHGACLTDEGDATRVGERAIAWLDRYVKGDTTVDTGAGFEFVDQDGVTYTAAEYGDGTGEPIPASGSGTLQLVAEGGAGPATVGTGADLVASFASAITPGRATNAVNVQAIAGDATFAVVGAAQLSLQYSGTVTPGERPTRVFAQLVDDTTGIVIGNQITPIEVVLDGQPHEVTVPLESIGFTFHAGSTITLQIVATTVAYAVPQLGGSIEFTDITLELPVMAGLSS